LGASYFGKLLVGAGLPGALAGSPDMGEPTPTDVE